MSRRALIPMLLILAPAAALAAGSVHIERVDAGEFPTIRIGMAFAGATMARTPVPADLKLFEDDHQVRDFQLAVDPEPLYIALVLDRSGSMEPAMEDLKRAATTFIDQLPPGAKLEILAFSDDVTHLQTLTADRRVLCAAVDRLGAHGATALYDAIGEGLETLSSTGPGRRVLIAFTDGRDQNAAGNAAQSRLSAKEVASRARQKGVPLYLVGLGDQVQTGLLTKLAQVSRGRYCHAPSRTDLLEIYRDIARMLQASFMATYQTPRPARDGKRRNLKLQSLAQEFPGIATGDYTAPSVPAEAGHAPLAAGPVPAGPVAVGTVKVGPVMAGPVPVGPVKVGPGAGSAASLDPGALDRATVAGGVSVRAGQVRAIPPGALDPFALGLFTLDRLVSTGHADIDAYDATRGPYKGQKEAMPSGPGCEIRSNGSVIMEGIGTIHGTVIARSDLSMTGSNRIKGRAVVGRNVTLGGTSDIHGDVMAGGTLSKTGSNDVKGTVTTMASVEIPVVTLPAINLGDLATSNDNAGLVPNDYLDEATPPNCKMDRTDTVTMASGVYCFHDLEISGSIDVVPQGPVMVFVTGALSFSGTANINRGGLPANLVIYCTGTDPAEMGGSVEFTGAIYAPSTAVKLSGSVDVFGAIVARTLEISGTADVHLDRSLTASRSRAIPAQNRPVTQAPPAVEPSPETSAADGPVGATPGADGSRAASDAGAAGRTAREHALETARQAREQGARLRQEAQDAAARARDEARRASEAAREAARQAREALRNR
ncbi:MAG: VWA domain-containing protein [Candidatus Riflebacteria bacterium]|nr:VWA domain-containing protein [Candidatus Riflebacteria bacterium]